MEEKILKVTDHYLSKEEFSLKYNPKYDWFETFPKPENISDYYKGDYISHTDSKKGLIDFCYQFVKKITLKQKIKLIEKYLPQKGFLLDIGAGSGDFLHSAQQNHWKINGVEPSQNARNKAKNKGIILHETFQNINQKHHCITMWHSLEHISELKEQINFLKNNLYDNGILVIAVPNYKSKDAQIYKEFWAAYDVPRHLWHFSQQSIEKLFSEFDFQIIEKKQMIFDAFYVSLLSEKYKTGKNNFIKAFYNGLISNIYGMKTNEFSSMIYILKKIVPRGTINNY